MNNPDLLEFLKTQSQVTLQDRQRDHSTSHLQIQSISKRCSLVALFSSLDLDLEPQLELSAKIAFLFHFFHSVDVKSKFIWVNRDQEELYFGFGEAIDLSLDDYKKWSLVSEDFSLMLSDNLSIWGGEGFDAKLKRYFIPSIQCSIPIKDSLTTMQISLNYNLRKESRSMVELNELLLKMISSLSDRTVKRTLDLSQTPQPLAQLATIQSSPKRFEWNKQINLALLKIKNNEIDKVVLARKQTFKVDSDQASWQLFLTSWHKNKNCYHLYWKMDNGNVLVSASPERLLYRNDNILTTEALAGTVKRSEHKAEDQNNYNWLKNDNKNQRENELVVQDIMTQLQGFTKKWISRSEPHILQQRQVQHLKVTLSAQLDISESSKTTQFYQGLYIDQPLLKSLHPTAAMAGLPRKEAIEFIIGDPESKELFEREWYSGYFGYSTAHESEYSVIIRCAYFNRVDEQLLCHCYAGAGILDGSSADTEWDEIDDKLTTMMGLFQWI